MGKRLTPEEREARIKAYEEAKAARQVARLEKRKARLEAYEKAKVSREKKKEFEKRGAKPAEILDSTRNGQVRAFPSYPGEVQEGDEVGFRFLGMAMSGKLIKILKERNYRVRDTDAETEEIEEEVTGRETYITLHQIQEADGTVYPIRKNDILAKKVDGVWVDKFNYKQYDKQQ